MRASSIALALAASTVNASNLPARYNNSLAGATFLSTYENGGVVPGPDGPDQYQEVFIQAIDGNVVFTRNPPTRICPCSDTFGAKNFTGFYISERNNQPLLQLFTSSPGAQYVYVAPDLSIRYTLPGEPVPPFANGTSISFYDNEPLGGGLPSSSAANIQGSITDVFGQKTYYNGYQFCAPPGSPPRTEDGIGPLSISATRTKGNTPNGQQIVDKHCITGFFATSINDPPVAPYDINFRTPSEPLAFAYAN